jgi:tetratricopeptide (TPR) repeat protein
LDRLTAEALGHLEKALVHDPNHIDALIALSTAHLDQGNFREVEKLLNRALSIRKDQSEVFFLMATSQALQDENESASKSIDKAIEIEAEQPKYFRLASEIAKKRQISFEHQVFLERLIDLEPLDGEAHYELGKIFHHPDDFDRVKLLFEIAIELLPRNTRPMYSLACHLYQGEKSLEDGSIRLESDIPYAKKLLKKILAVNSGEAEAKILLAEIELKSDEEVSAVRLLEEALENQRSRGEAAYKLGLIWQKKDKRTKAKKYYLSAMEHEDWEALSQFRLALVMLEQGQTKEPIRHLHQCISSFKKEEASLVKSKDQHLEKLNFHASRKELQSLQLIRKCLGEANLAIYKSKQVSKVDKTTLGYLNEALLHYPHYPKANYEKGLYFIQSGERENAKTKFENSVEGDWNHWPSHMELAKLAKIGKEWQKAEMHFKIVLDLDPGNKQATIHLKQIQAAPKK